MLSSPAQSKQFPTIFTPRQGQTFSARLTFDLFYLSRLRNRNRIKQSRPVNHDAGRAVFRVPPLNYRLRCDIIFPVFVYSLRFTIRVRTAKNKFNLRWT